MKKTILLIYATLLGGYINHGYAFDVSGCYSYTCSEAAVYNWYDNRSPSGLNCNDSAVTCVHYSDAPTGVASCISCPAGYVLENVSGNIAACSETADAVANHDYGSFGSYNYNKCTRNCQTSNCASDDWRALRTGYETRTYRSCSATGTSGTCNASTQYQCAAGYWGSSSNGTSGCNPCPEWQNVFANSARTTKVYGTSAAGATSITGCYVVAGTYYDATGTFKTSGNCQYK